jgi:hypothetical protein
VGDVWQTAGQGTELPRIGRRAGAHLDDLKDPGVAGTLRAVMPSNAKRMGAACDVDDILLSVAIDRYSCMKQKLKIHTLVRCLGKLNGMACRIELHRRLLLGAGWFSSRRGRLGVSALYAIAISTGLKISQVLERFAWRLLVQREVSNIFEAEQKTLYVIATILARAKTLEPGDTPAIIESTAKFKGRLGNLLRKDDQ